MAWADPYVDATTLKSRLGISGTAQDAVLAAVVVAASRAIDDWTGRCFNQTPVGTARYLTARYPDFLDVPDLVSVSELAMDGGTRTYDTVWLATDYDLAPYDAADRGWPYAEIRVAPTGTLVFWGYARGVRVTGVWGWPAVPAPIAEAAALQATRMYKRKDAPFGVTGSAELGQLQTISRIDPDVAQLIAPYRVGGV